MTTSREEWLAKRKLGLGSSDAAAVVGLSPYKTPLQVQLDKLGYETFDGNKATRWGSECEASVAKIYEEESGVKLSACEMFQHPQNPILLATPDRFTEDGRIVEIKVTGERNADRWGMAGTDAIPQEHLVQVQWQHYVVSAHRGTPLGAVDVAVVIGMGDFRIYKVDPHAELQGALAEQATAWWKRHIIDRDPVNATGADLNEAAKVLHKKVAGDFLTVAEDDFWINYTMLAYNDVRQKITALEGIEAGIAGHLKMLIGDRPGLTGSFGKVNYGKPGSSTSWKSVAEELGATPALIEKHKSPKARSLVPYFVKTLPTKE